MCISGTGALPAEGGLAREQAEGQSVVLDVSSMSDVTCLIYRW